MNTKRIEEIQKETAYPDSISVQQALLKVWNECEQKTSSISAMTKTDELLRKFAEKYGKQSLDMIQGNNCVLDYSQECLSDLRTLIKQVEQERMPSEEEIREEADLLYSKEIFIAACEWFRNRMTSSEKPNNINK